MRTLINNLKNKPAFYYLFILIILFMAGCRGHDGRPGRDGNDGNDGNANVRTAIYDVPPQHWTGNENGYRAILPVAEITSDIYDNGAVLVYLLDESDPSNKSFDMLPFTQVDGASITYMDYNAYVGEIDLFLKWVDGGGNTTQVPGSTESFKVVIIQGTPLSVLKSKIDVTNYKTVLAYFGTKDNNKIIIIK